MSSESVKPLFPSATTTRAASQSDEETWTFACPKPDLAPNLILLSDFQETKPPGQYLYYSTSNKGEDVYNIRKFSYDQDSRCDYIINQHNGRAKVLPDWKEYCQLSTIGAINLVKELTKLLASRGIKIR
jgi:hypothetical protein